MVRFKKYEFFKGIKFLSLTSEEISFFSKTIKDRYINLIANKIRYNRKDTTMKIFLKISSLLIVCQISVR